MNVLVKLKDQDDQLRAAFKDRIIDLERLSHGGFNRDSEADCALVRAMAAYLVGSITFDEAEAIMREMGMIT